MPNLNFAELIVRIPGIIKTSVLALGPLYKPKPASNSVKR